MKIMRNKVLHITKNAKITQNGMSHVMGLHMLYVNNKGLDQQLCCSILFTVDIPKNSNTTCSCLP